MFPPPTPRPPVRRENRLARSSSPYLLQHRFNPVDWHPWGAEAFEEARQRNVPIFLSIGYSTCYWCHVMERESFESDAIAALMNRLFVCIKVDREQRPDVDDVYMAAVQAFTSHGGWPMSVFLEPRSLKPFWAGTYFPAEPRFVGGGGDGGAMPTFPRVLQSISDAWRDQRAEVTEQADKLAEAVRERLAAQSAPVRIGVAQVQEAVAGLIRLHDDRHGGFGSAPKFPQPVYIELLLEVRASADEATRRAIDAALRVTLTQMALGGIFDQVGGGFHRYSVDARWVVPHFEKMLYDNAQLAAVFSAAARVFDEPLYRRTAERTLEYVLREMTATGGGVGNGFFSAQDAEVNHREGQNYLWTPAQVRGVLEPADAVLAIKVYALDKGPNFRDPHHPDDPPANVLRWADVPSVVAQALGLSEAELLSKVERINGLLYDARAQRDQPSTDDKVISGWNGLMIAAFARAGASLGRPDFIAAGERAAAFVLERMRGGRGGGGGLQRAWRAESPAGDEVGGFLEDYACMAHACVELHRTGNDASGKWLDQARGLIADVEGRFGDAASGAFFDTLADQPDLFVRARSAYDGAIPSGSSVMVNTLIDLFEVTGDSAYFDRAVRALRSISAFLADAPLGAAGSTRALLRLLRVDKGAVETAFAADTQPRQAVAADFTPVEVHAAVERLALSPGRPASLTLRFRIAEGYHINAADVGDGPDTADLIPLRVSIVGGSGVDIFADYTAGTPFGVDGRLRVHSGGFELTVVVERTGVWNGTPLIGVTYQACTEDACLAPRTVELDVALDAVD